MDMFLNAQLFFSNTTDLQPVWQGFVPPLKGNVIGNGEVNRNGKQLTNGKRNDCFNVKQGSNAYITKSLKC
jgi:hypothetical protein